MSYDLIFWRGKAIGDPGDVCSSLNRNEKVAGIVEISRDEICAAFRREFSDLQDDDQELLGPGFSVMLYVSPIRYVAVCCNWGILKRPDILEKIERAGFSNLKCHRYNPQLNEFKENPAALV